MPPEKRNNSGAYQGAKYFKLLSALERYKEYLKFDQRLSKRFS